MIAPKRPLVGALLRTSTPEQNRAGQRAYIAEWADKRGVDLAWYEEADGTSGGLPLAERPETTRLLADAYARTIDAIVVCEVSRLNRLEAVENFVSIANLWLAKVPLYVLDRSEERPVDLTDFGDFLRIAFECGFASEERKKDSVRTKRAFELGPNGKKRARESKLPCGRPSSLTAAQTAKIKRLSLEGVPVPEIRRRTRFVHVGGKHAGKLIGVEAVRRAAEGA